MTIEAYDLVVSDVVELLRVSPNTVNSWIDTRELLAIDVRKKGAMRASWRIRSSDLEAFIQDRCNRPDQPRPLFKSSYPPPPMPEKIIQFV
ncbi:helix-turn-helix domain-containing protein [Rhodopirellula baltica]